MLDCLLEDTCYDTFMIRNISSDDTAEENLSNLLTLIGKPARIQILMVIRDEEACVCHIETVLGLRQASISQHLMVLRRAGLVSTHRDGRNVFYKIEKPELIGLLEQAAVITRVDLTNLDELSRQPIPDCPCPQCNPGIDPQLTCRPRPQQTPLSKLEE